MRVLGISAFYHDSAASLIEDGEILFAVQEERLTRIKHDSSFPKESINACLKFSNLSASDIDAIVFYEKPFLKFERLLETYLAFAPKGFTSFVKAIPLWLTEKLFQKKLLSAELEILGFTKKQINSILFSEHHLSHAASAFFCSPFDEAIVLTLDGVGEWETTAVFIGNKNQLTKVKEIRFPHSLGLLYSAFTYHCGFKVNSGEYKLMGLAPYGELRFVEHIKNNLIDIKEDGSFKLNSNYFDYSVGLKMTNSHFNSLFDNSFRQPEEPLLQIHMDLACSIQKVLEEVVLKICTSLRKEYKIQNLCLAGGVALNCAVNGKISRQKIFNNIWIQPAAGDAGGSLGAALAAYYIHFNKTRKINSPDLTKNSSLGPHYSNEQIEKVLIKNSLVYQKLNQVELDHFVASQLKLQKTLGWFEGKAEFGPRALGHRSILADSGSAEMQKNLNLKIKFRESFRPFAPILIEEDLTLWFEHEEPSSYMLFLAELKQEKKIQLSSEQKKLFGIEQLNIPRSAIPSLTHVDYTARLQTVNSSSRIYSLLKEFKKLTGYSVLVNTSFNIRGEPIVCSPEDALQCFFGTEIDLLVLENFVLLKSDQPVNTVYDYKKKFELD
jgi:carbamoyltransferase